MAAARPVVLSDEELVALRRLTRAGAAPAGLARRARVALLLGAAHSNAEVARLTDLHPVQVSRIRCRFLESGVDGLADRPRSGRPPEITSRQITRIVAMTLKPPPKGLSHWSTRELAERVGVSHMTVHRIWQDHALQPHRLQTFKFTNDPRAEEKIRDVVGVYLNPPDKALVVCLDDKTQIQALERTQPLLPLRENLPARQTHDYHRHGLTTLYAAMEVGSGKVVGACSKRHTAADFLRFMKKLNQRYQGRELHVVLDNSSTHRTPAVREWLARRPNVQFHFTPTGASWLNMIEAWFGVLTRKSVRRGSFPSVPKLVRHIGAYIERWNENPTPFVWTKRPAEIIRKAVRR